MGNSAVQQCYIVVLHRNIVGTWEQNRDRTGTEEQQCDISAQRGNNSGCGEQRRNSAGG